MCKIQVATPGHQFAERIVMIAVEADQDGKQGIRYGWLLVPIAPTGEAAAVFATISEWEIDLPTGALWTSTDYVIVQPPELKTPRSHKIFSWGKNL